MNASRPAKSSASAPSPEPAPEFVELSLLEGVDYKGLIKLLVTLWQEARFRVRLDCSQLDSLGTSEVRTLIRFADQFSHHGGFVRLVNANSRIGSRLEVLCCAELLADGRPDKRCLP
jgi:ABC-type transporter Mla MlaB component